MLLTSVMRDVCVETLGANVLGCTHFELIHLFGSIRMFQKRDQRNSYTKEAEQKGAQVFIRLAWPGNWVWPFFGLGALVSPLGLNNQRLGKSVVPNWA